MKKENWVTKLQGIKLDWRSNGAYNVSVWVNNDGKRDCYTFPFYSWPLYKWKTWLSYTIIKPPIDFVGYVYGNFRWKFSKLISKIYLLLFAKHLLDKKLTPTPLYHLAYAFYMPHKCWHHIKEINERAARGV